jgi:ribulose kinase
LSYTIGLDYGSNSVRCIIVNVTNGTELAADVFNYPTGDMGIAATQFCGKYGWHCWHMFYYGL